MLHEALPVCVVLRTLSCANTSWAETVFCHVEVSLRYPTSRWLWRKSSAPRSWATNDERVCACIYSVI